VDFHHEPRFILVFFPGSYLQFEVFA